MTLRLLMKTTDYNCDYDDDGVADYDCDNDNNDIACADDVPCIPF